MPIDVRQIGGVKANDSTDSQLIAALDLRYGTNTGTTGGSGGATVLPTFNPTNTVIFGSPGVSITPASTGSSTYNVQLGLPASLENVTGGSGSLSSSSTPTLTFDNSSGIETVSSGNGGLTISLKSGQTTDYYVSLKLPTSLLVGGNSAVSVGTTLNKGSVTFSNVADSYGVFPESTSANTYNLNLVLPNGATVTGTGGSGSGGGGLQDITFNTVSAEYTASPATNAQVSIGGTGASRNVKLILPATASQTGGIPDEYVSSVVRKDFQPYSSTNDFQILSKADNSVEIGLSLTGGAGSVAGGTTPQDTPYIGTGLDWVILDDVTLDDTAGSTIKKKIPYGFSAVKITAKLTGAVTNIPCYGMCLKVKGTPTGDYTQEYYDAMIGFLLVDATNVKDSNNHELVPPVCEFRFVYSFSNDNTLHGFQLFDLSKKDFQGGTGSNAPVFTPWVDLGELTVQQFADGLSNYSAMQEGFLPLVVKIKDAKNPNNPSEANSLYYYLLMMKRTDRASERAGLNAYGGFGINSAGDPIYLTYAKTGRTNVGQLSVGKLAVEYSTNIATFA